MNLPMNSFTQLAYDGIAVPALRLFLRAGGFFNAKFAERERGEGSVWQKLATLPPASEAPRLWAHAASLGEFEQIRPILERVKTRLPNAVILVTFFSPSGYRYRHDYPLADAVTYMPIDSEANARRFVETANPDAALFARYDLWANHVRALGERDIPFAVACATLNERSLAWRLPLARSFTRGLYDEAAVIFTAGQSETAKFERMGARARIVTAADTRFDRVATLVEESKTRPLLSVMPFEAEMFVLALGSSWQKDEEFVLEAVERLRGEGYRIGLVVAPHDPTPATIERLRAAIPHSVSLSELLAISETVVARSASGADIIADSVGKLSRLYAYCSAAVIGGGFGAGVHSVIEPAGYGVPLACGPNVARARDAVALKEQGALTIFRSSEEYYRGLKKLLDSPAERERQGAIAREYVHSSTGWSEHIAEETIRLISQRRDARFYAAAKQKNSPQGSGL